MPMIAVVIYAEIECGKMLNWPASLMHNFANGSPIIIRDVFHFLLLSDSDKVILFGSYYDY